MADPQPRRGFQTPREVTDYFDQKNLRPAFSWLDVWGEEHAYSFTVAKATELELLTLFKTTISDALRNGQGFETWQKNLLPQLAKIGWDKPRTVEDPTGEREPAVVDFTSPRRLQTIFWSNMNAARSAGQWERAQRTKDAFPYVLYVRTSSKDPRREHLGWVGTILPIDDPWWHTHWPPNGWGCKCSVRQVTARERDRLLGATPAPGGITYRADAPDDGPPRVFHNARTGEITEVPAGIDPGWGTNPGLARARSIADALTTRLMQAGSDDARATIADVLASPLPRVVQGLPEEVLLPVAVAPAGLATDLDAARIVTVSNKQLAPASGATAPAETVPIDSLADVQSVLDTGETTPGVHGGMSAWVGTGATGSTWRVILAAAGKGAVMKLLGMFKGRSKAP